MFLVDSGHGVFVCVWGGGQLGAIVSGTYASEMLRYACNYDFWVIRKTRMLIAGKWILGGGIQ
jgi:hypothetical protein